MQTYPHHYQVRASGQFQGYVDLASGSLPPIRSAPPVEFDGPGDAWSPESLLVAAVADCFILTFRAVARAARFDWDSLECTVEGVLERVDRTSSFTRFVTRAVLNVPAGADPSRARDLLERAEHGCLVANSLRGERSLEATINEQATAAKPAASSQP